MFSKLKSAVSDGPIKSVIEKVAPQLLVKLEEVSKLGASDIKNDEKFKSIVVAPALLAVQAASSGATRLIPNFDDRFGAALLHLRNELIVVDESNNQVTLAANFQSRLADVLVEGFKKQS